MEPWARSCIPENFKETEALIWANWALVSLLSLTGTWGCGPHAGVNHLNSLGKCQPHTKHCTAQSWVQRELCGNWISTPVQHKLFVSETKLLFRKISMPALFTSSLILEKLKSGTHLPVYLQPHFPVKWPFTLLPELHFAPPKRKPECLCHSSALKTSRVLKCLYDSLALYSKDSTFHSGHISQPKLPILPSFLLRNTSHSSPRETETCMSPFLCTTSCLPRIPFLPLLANSS